MHGQSPSIASPHGPRGGDAFQPFQGQGMRLDEQMLSTIPLEARPQYQLTPYNIWYPAQYSLIEFLAYYVPDKNLPIEVAERWQGVEWILKRADRYRQVRVSPIAADTTYSGLVVGVEQTNGQPPGGVTEHIDRSGWPSYF